MDSVDSRLRDENRLAALSATGLMDSPAEPAYDRLTALAARIIGAPVALVSLVNQERQFFKSAYGFDVEPWATLRGTPLSHSFCQHVVATGEPLIVGDAREEPLLAQNAAIADLGVIAYAGIPLRTADGSTIGSFCVIDQEPRQWTDDQVRVLKDLAAAAMTEVELRLDIRQRQTVEAELVQTTESLRLTQDLLVAISEAQAGFLLEGDPRATFGHLLDTLLRLTRSEYGFIGEVLYRDAAPYLKIHAITNIAWDDTTRALFAKHEAGGLEFTNLNTLFGQVMVTGEPVIANAPADDPRRGGLPPGHPALNAFLGLPTAQGGQLNGMLGIGNRRGGYDRGLVAYLQPFTATVATLIAATRLNADKLSAEQSLRASETRLAEQNAQLRQLDRLKDGFVASVSHELRTPLTSIMSFAELLRETGPLTEEASGFLDVIDRNANRLLHLIGDLLLLARLESQTIALEPAPLSLPRVLHEAVEAIRPQTEAKRVRLRVMTGEGPPLVADRIRLGQLLDNVLSNAVKFTDRGGAVTVAARFTCGRWEAEVADSGMGIPEADQASLFQRFYRASNAQSAAVPGTGLGLAIVRAIAELHHAELGIDSAVDVGTTIRVRFPAEDTEGCA